MSSTKVVTKVEQKTFVVPDLTVKDLLSAIPAHCFKRSGLKSSLYVLWDFVLIAVIYKVTAAIDAGLLAQTISLPSAALYPYARFALWALYSLGTGLVATGLWVIAHECGHQAYSESKLLNNTVGWVLHSALGVPYHSWRISHSKHHAATGHMTLEQVFVPKTRSQSGLPPLDPSKEDIHGASITEDAKNELIDALGDSPLGAALGSFGYLIVGWPIYLIMNASGQRHYPSGTNHFVPKAPLFAPHQAGQVILSDIGIFIWLGTLIFWSYQRGFAEMFRVYLVPYLWVNHWLVLITFLQHTDPLLPHYRAPEFTFPRGALATMDRNLLGGLGSFAGWIGATTTHGISETHVLHHVSSKIPHYNAWEAADALRARLARAGVTNAGQPGGWGEVYRVFKQCRFVEDEGNVVFYKNAEGLAQCRPVLPGSSASDSGVEVDK